jgi:hypothetical protein
MYDSVNGTTLYTKRNFKAEEKRLLTLVMTLVNDLNRAMFVIRYQSLHHPPATSHTVTTHTYPTALTTPNGAVNSPIPIHPMSNPTPRNTQLRDREMTQVTPDLPPSRQAHIATSASIPFVLSATLPARREMYHRHPAQYTQASVRSRPNPELHLAVNANAFTNTVTTTVDHTSSRGVVNNNAMRHAPPVTATPLTTPATEQTDPLSSPTNEEISERGDDRQDD